MDKALTGDKLDAAMIRLVEDTKSYVGKESVNAAIAAIPYVGGSILSVTGDIATKRFRERTIEMFTIMRDQVAAIGEDRLEKDYFQSEDFQTLLFLAWEQLRTTHDKKKIRMLATGLSNSGNRDFTSETRKELFFRIIRDLSPLQVAYLQGMHRLIEVKNPDEEAQGIYASLAAHGLVTERFESERMPSLPNISINISKEEISRFLREALERVPTRIYQINDFGMAFLRFLTVESAGTGGRIATPSPKTE